MQVYRRKIFSLIKSIVIAVVTGVFLYFILDLFLPGTNWPLLIGGGIGLILLYWAFFSENIRFEIENDLFRYYQRGRLKHEFSLKDCTARYHIKTDSSFPSTSDINLYLIPANQETEIMIDCSPLGFNQFQDLFAQIEQLAQTKAPKLKTIKATKK